ncbi:enterobactin transporter EntS [Nocardia puris]|uniref:enterobactin transporter EntS n=1 Tax=Nocardia puris TaxID=208602 RepID=UPI001E462D69|nr:enterobactin transporter EntS [Nocardia puris]
MTRMSPRRIAIDLDPLRSSREFRTLFIARAISVLGIGFLMVALPIQVYQLTGSTARIAMVTVVAGAATFGGTLIGGALADRVDRRTVIVVARGAATLGFALLAVNAMLPSPQVWLILACGVIDGAAGGISATALVAAMPGLVPRDKMAAAGALMALTVDLGTMVGPALGGLLIAWAGVAANYWLAAVASLVTTVLIARLDAMPPHRAHAESSVRAMVSGFRFAFGHRIIGSTLLAGVVTMVLAGWSVLIPAYVGEVLHGGSAVAGLLFAAPAIGAVAGSLTSGWTGGLRRGGIVIFGAALVSAAGLAGAGMVGTTVCAFVGLFAYGVGRVVGDIAKFAVVQQNTPDEFRGRVSGVWTAQVTVAAAVGAVVAGVVSELVPAREVFLVYGALGGVLTLVLWGALGPLRQLGSEENVSAER